MQSHLQIMLCIFKYNYFKCTHSSTIFFLPLLSLHLAMNLQNQLHEAWRYSTDETHQHSPLLSAFYLPPLHPIHQSSHDILSPHTNMIKSSGKCDDIRSLYQLLFRRPCTRCQFLKQTDQLSATSYLFSTWSLLLTCNAYQHLKFKKNELWTCISFT